MSQDLVLNLDFNEFERAIKSPDFRETTARVQHLMIRNPKAVVHFPLATKEELPLNGILFPYIQEVLQFENLRELRLIGISLNGLPAEFSALKELRRLTLEFSFSANDNVEHIIKSLSEFKFLEEIDLTGSRLTMKNRDRISKALIPKGIRMNDLIYIR